MKKWSKCFWTLNATNFFFVHFQKFKTSKNQLDHRCILHRFFFLNFQTHFALVMLCKRATNCLKPNVYFVAVCFSIKLKCIPHCRYFVCSNWLFFNDYLETQHKIRCANVLLMRCRQAQVITCFAFHEIHISKYEYERSNCF